MSQIVNMAKQTNRLVPQITKQGKFLKSLENINQNFKIKRNFKNFY